MWAQLIKGRLKPGKDEEFRRWRQEMAAATAQERVVVRSTTMRDPSEPSMHYTLVVFESEEKARSRENDARRQEAIQRVGDLFDGPREFINLEVLD